MSYMDSKKVDPAKLVDDALDSAKQGVSNAGKTMKDNANKTLNIITDTLENSAGAVGRQYKGAWNDISDKIKSSKPYVWSQNVYKKYLEKKHRETLKKLQRIGNYSGCLIQPFIIGVVMKKHLTYKQILNNAFNFTYAGVCDVFISCFKSKYTVVCSGFTYDGINYFFSKNRCCRYTYDDLYHAILCFNKITKELVSSMDWYKPDYFNSEDFMKVVNDNVY